MPKQQTKSFRVNLFPLTAVNLEKLDEWLLAVFDVNIESYFHSKQPVLDETEQLAYEVTWRGLHLVNIFLQFANIPAFYSKSDIHLQKDERHNLSATFSVADIVLINMDAYNIAIGTAFELVQWMSVKEKNDEHIEQLYKRVEKKCRNPIKRFYSGGKSTLPILKAAFEANIPFIHLGGGVYQLGWGPHSRQISRSTTEIDSAIGARIAQDKTKSAVLLRMAGLPAPQHMVVNSLKSAYAVVSQLGWPLVVKPTNCDRGEGVTVGIKNNVQLKAAFTLANQFSKRRPVIVEKEVAGVCHRLFISDGQLLYAIQRQPLSVVADGHQTVAQLIADTEQQENRKAPWLRTYHYPNDALAVETMQAKGYSLTSIPELDELVPLRPFQSDVWGGTPKEVTDNVHPDNIKIAIKAAQDFGLFNAGIDIISSDISQPWHENGAIINEVNFSPLFGGTEISKQYVPNFLASFIDGDGRIPVEVFVGGEQALIEAKNRHKTLLSKDVMSSLTSHDLTLDRSEKERVMPFNSLKQRCLALLMDREVEALIVVVQSNECIFEGLAFDQINRLTLSGGLLTSRKNEDEVISTQAGETVNRLFEKMLIG